MSVEANSWGVRIDADVIQGIEDCRELAPLHNARHAALMLTKFLFINFAISESSKDSCAIHMAPMKVEVRFFGSRKRPLCSKARR